MPFFEAVQIISRYLYTLRKKEEEKNMSSNFIPPTGRTSNVVSARYAELCVEKTKVQFLQQEIDRLRSELEQERARNRSFNQIVHHDLRKSQQDHVQTLQQHNQQLLMSTAMAMDALLNQYGSRLLPRHVPLKAKQQDILRLAQESCASNPPRNAAEWQQRLYTIEKGVEQNRQQIIRKAIAEELNQTIKTAPDATRRLEELDTALVDCQVKLSSSCTTLATIQQPLPPGADEKLDTVKDMVDMLKTEREILAQGIQKQSSNKN